MSDELQYETSSPNLDRPRSSMAMASALAVFVVLLAAGAATYYFLRRDTPPAVAPLPAAAESAPAAPAAPSPAAARVALPPLEASDDFVRQQLEGLGGAAWREWLTSDGLARRFAAAVYAVAEGHSPRRAIERPLVTGRFAVVSVGDETRIDPASYARYDAIASTIAAIDVDRAVAAYRLLHPLLDQAWGEVGAPGDTLDSAARRAIDQLLAAPEAPAEATVELREGLYRWSDPTLESSTAAQKHLLRMGPANAAKLKTALRRWRAAL
jgi:hypothetical protein